MYVQDVLQVTVKDDSVTAPSGLEIQGYDVKVRCKVNVKLVKSDNGKTCVQMLTVGQIRFSKSVSFPKLCVSSVCSATVLVMIMYIVYDTLFYIVFINYLVKIV